MPQISPMKWIFLNLLPLLILFQIVFIMMPKNMTLGSLNYTPNINNSKISWKW